MDRELVKKNAISAIIACSVFAAISIAGFICIVIFDTDRSDILLFGFVFGGLLATCIWGVIRSVKQYKNPEKASEQKSYVLPKSIGYHNAEWNWDVAEANYRTQHNVTGELSEQDKDMIWKYCAAEISYYIAWLIDKDFMVKDPAIPAIEADLEQVRIRKISPDVFLSGIDMKLTEDDVTEEAWPFIDYCLGDGFESIDSFFERVSGSKVDVLSDKYAEKESRHCNFAFDWAFYDEFKALLDKEYINYSGGNS